MFRKTLQTLVLLTVFSSISAEVTASQELEKPSGAVVLTVIGAIGATNGDNQAKFDMTMLRRLPSSGFTTTTIWTEGRVEFRGVALSDLLKAVGAQGTTLTASALNDYAVDIPMSDVTEGEPIVAFEMNGKPMAVREKGPLWIVYPYDDNEAYRSETVYSRSIWQLSRIEVLK